MLLPESKIMIIGGAGYVGTAFCELLDAQGVSFAIYDNFSATGKTNVEEQGWRYYEGDIVHKASLAAALREYAPTHVVALAALHFIPYCIENPHEVIAVNMGGTQNLIEAIADAPHAIDLLFISSAAVYFDSEQPLAETDGVGPIDIYGSSKLFAEQLIRAKLNRYKIIRLFNVYGKADPHPHIIPRLHGEMSQKTASIRLGNTESLRDYIHVDDVAHGIYAVLSAGQPQETYNLGTGKAHSVTDVIQLLAQQSGYTPTIVSRSKEYTRKQDRMVLCADITKITAHTGWKPRTMLHEGLQTLR